MRLREKTRLNEQVATKVLKWTKHKATGAWLLNNEITGFGYIPESDFQYFNPAENIKHAWVILENNHARRDSVSYRLWAELQLATLFNLRERDAAKIICQIALKYPK